MPLNPKHQQIVDEVAGSIFYHSFDATHREKLRVNLTRLCEVLVQDLPNPVCTCHRQGDGTTWYNPACPVCTDPR